MVRPVYYIYKQTRPFYSHVKKKKKICPAYIHTSTVPLRRGGRESTHADTRPARGRERYVTISLAFAFAFAFAFAIAIRSAPTTQQSTPSSQPSFSLLFFFPLAVARQYASFGEYRYICMQYVLDVCRYIGTPYVVPDMYVVVPPQPQSQPQP